MDDLIAFVRAQLDTDEKRERSRRTFKGWPTGNPCPECGRPVADVTVTQRHDAAEVEFDPCGDVMAGEEFFKRYAESAEDPVVLADIDSKRRLIDELLRYEAKIDSEWGCVHSAEDIASGKCRETPPDEIEGVRLLALPYAGRPGYKEKWRP